MPVPNVYKPSLIQIRPQYQTLAADIAENILWFLGTFTTPLTLTQLQTIQNTFDADWYSVWNSVGGNGITYHSCYVTDWSSAAGGQAVPNSANYSPGTKGSAVPINAAALLSLQIPFRYRGGHGRVYLPGLGDGVLLDDQSMGSTPISALETTLTAFQTAMGAIPTSSGGGFSWVIYRERNNALKAGVWPISSIVVNGKLATQRRRLRKAAHR